MKFKVSLIIGTRPEAIKLIPLVNKFKANSLFEPRIIMTGQHTDMVLDVMQLFNIKEDLNINCMKENQSLCHISIETLSGLEKHFKQNRPDLTIVQGDTNSAFAGALASFYNNIPVAHVEAGLRTKDINIPFPEEANRRLISQISSLNFAPTKNALINLKNNKLPGESFLTGNTVIDAVMMIDKKSDFENKQIQDLPKGNYILVTLHRRESWETGIFNVICALKKIINKYSDYQLLIPMHKNKIVRDQIIYHLNNFPRVNLVEPMVYQDFINAIKHSKFVLTDSGGIQEEAPTLGKPVLVVRENTERTEGILAGTAKLVGTNADTIFKEASSLIESQSIYNSMANAKNPYGDGNASKKIVKHCEDFLKKRY